MLFKGAFDPMVFNNSLPSYFLINLNFLQSHTAHFDNSISFTLFAFAIFAFLLSVFFHYHNIVLDIV